MDNRRPEFFVVVLVVALIATAAAACCMAYALEVFPGVIGDEADIALIWDALRHEDGASLRTPSGGFHHPLLGAAVELAQGVFGHTYAALRWPMVLFTWLGIVGVVGLARRRYGLPGACVLAAVYAAHPMVQHYARISWQSSMLLLVAGLVWFPLRDFAGGQRLGWRWAAVVFGLLCVLAAHPLNAMWLVALGFACLWCRASGELQPRFFTRRMLGLLWVGGLAVVATAAVYIDNPTTYGEDLIGKPFYTVAALAEYAEHVVGILSGARIFDIVVGSGWTAGALLQSVVICGLLAWALSWLRRRDRNEFRFAAVAGGTALALSFTSQPMFNVTVGADRYALFLVPCVCFTIGAAIARAQDALGPRRAAALLIVYVVCSLTTLGTEYFGRGFATQNMQSHRTFWCGAHPGDHDPKVKVAQWIAGEEVDSDVLVLVGDFWMRAPLRYLLQRSIGFYLQPDCWSVLPEPVWRTRKWIVVEYATERGTRRLRQLCDRFDATGIAYKRETVRSAAGAEQALIVYRLIRSEP